MLRVARTSWRSNVRVLADYKGMCMHGDRSGLSFSREWLAPFGRSEVFHAPNALSRESARALGQTWSAVRVPAQRVPARGGLDALTAKVRGLSVLSDVQT